MASDSDKVTTEATVWLARLERGLQAQEGAQLRAWLQQPGQQAAIVEAAKLWHGPDIVAVLAELVPVGFGTPAPPRRKVLQPFALGVGIFLALAMVATPFLFMHHIMLPLFPAGNKSAAAPQPHGATLYTTKSGQTRAVVLADGSKVTLNSHTQVGILFEGGLRHASVEYGEAIFQVAPERERRFEVSAGGRHFRAPPSMFDIRVINPQAVELMVLNGGVTVQGLAWHWPTSPAEARVFDPDVFVDTTVGPLQAAMLQDQMINRYPITAANAQQRLRWKPEDVIYVTP